MNVSPINNSQTFKGLNCRYLCKEDSRFIKDDLEKLYELGKNYDIKLVSTFEGIPNFSGIDVTVTQLKENTDFVHRLFTPTGRSTFPTGRLFAGEGSVLDSVREAIRNLNHKLH